MRRIVVNPLEQASTRVRRMVRKFRSGEEGFTLVEMMVTLIVMSIVIAVTSAIIVTLVNDDTATGDSIAGLRQAETATESFVQYLQSAAGSSTASAPDECSTSPFSYADGDGMEFSSYIGYDSSTATADSDTVVAQLIEPSTDASRDGTYYSIFQLGIGGSTLSDYVTHVPTSTVASATRGASERGRGNEGRGGRFTTTTQYQYTTTTQYQYTTTTQYGHTTTTTSSTTTTTTSPPPTTTTTTSPPPTTTPTTSPPTTSPPTTSPPTTQAPTTTSTIPLPSGSSVIDSFDVDTPVPTSSAPVPTVGTTSTYPIFTYYEESSPGVLTPLTWTPQDTSLPFDVPSSELSEIAAVSYNLLFLAPPGRNIAGAVDDIPTELANTIWLENCQ